ncbi:hypothetical protein GGR33_001087 [Methylobacterium brachythecii]|uniref:Uncharacterized protein n=1 Tax=Methylobacterium brachythecii TaxID=1176177 RepID=A0A7W6AG03_9HYPH|nr:hypothetical protein [Methylobacterium brachythecii]
MAVPFQDVAQPISAGASAFRSRRLPLLQSCVGTDAISAWKPSVNDAVLILPSAKPGGSFVR